MPCSFCSEGGSKGGSLFWNCMLRMEKMDIWEQYPQRDGHLQLPEVSIFISAQQKYHLSWLRHKRACVLLWRGWCKTNDLWGYKTEECVYCKKAWTSILISWPWWDILKNIKRKPRYNLSCATINLWTIRTLCPLSACPSRMLLIYKDFSALVIFGGRSGQADEML